MYKNYVVLQKLPAKAYLAWHNFTTPFDDNDDYASGQYAKGLQIGRDSRRVGISANGTWFAVGKDNTVTSSHEGIGYHRSTANLLKGFLDSGCEFIVYRYGTNAYVKIAG